MDNAFLFMCGGLRAPHNFTTATIKLTRTEIFEDHSTNGLPLKWLRVFLSGCGRNLDGVRFDQRRLTGLGVVGITRFAAGQRHCQH